MKQQLGSHHDHSLRARQLRIGLLGCGTVGSEVARMLREAPPDGTRLDRVAVRDIHKNRSAPISRAELTGDALAVVKDPEIDIVVELIGGIEPSFGLIRQAIAEGKHVVTANKAVLARHGSVLKQAAAERGVGLLYEGSAGAAIPIVRTLRAVAKGDRIRSVNGVLNGTTNYVLCQMEKGMAFQEALAAAQHHGYAESEATEDVEGIDAACKLTILASLAFGVDVPFESISRCGIADISSAEVHDAITSGRRMKLLATATARSDGSISALVAPVAIDGNHPLARLEGVENGVVLESEYSGRLSFYGEGAGGRPTAAAVMADIEEIARGLAPAPAVGTALNGVAPDDYERRTL